MEVQIKEASSEVKLTYCCRDVLIKEIHLGPNATYRVQDLHRFMRFGKRDLFKTQMLPGHFSGRRHERLWLAGPCRSPTPQFPAIQRTRQPPSKRPTSTRLLLSPCSENWTSDRKCLLEMKLFMAFTGAECSLGLLVKSLLAQNLHSPKHSIIFPNVTNLCLCRKDCHVMQAPLQYEKGCCGP